MKYTTLATLVGLAFGGWTSALNAQRSDLPPVVTPFESWHFSQAWLGISQTPVLSSASARRSGHVTVNAVHPGSPAELAGIQPGDTIVRVNDRTDAAAEMRTLRLQAGDTVRLRIRRAGERDRDLVVVASPRPYAIAVPGRPPTMTELRRTPSGERVVILNGDTIRFPDEFLARHAEILAKQAEIVSLQAEIVSRQAELFAPRADSLRQRLQDLRADSMVLHMRRFEAEHLPRLQQQLRGVDSAVVRSFRDVGFFQVGLRGVAGAEFSDLDPELATFFDGASEGVLVLRVVAESPAARGGLRAGDVVTRANGEPVRSVHELRRTVARDRDGEVRLDVIRRGRAVTVQLP